MRYLLIGEAPARDPLKTGLQVTLALRASGILRPRAEIGSALSRLDEDLLSFIAATTHVNVLDAWPGRDGRGSAFPLRAARKAACRLGQSDLVGAHDLVLLAGTRVREAMSISSKVPHFTPAASPFILTRFVLTIPHPSGLCRWWNERHHRERAREFLRQLGRMAGSPGVAACP